MPKLRVLALCKSQAVNGGLDEFDLKCPPISLEKALRKIFPHERCYAPAWNADLQFRWRL